MGTPPVTLWDDFLVAIVDDEASLREALEALFRSTGLRTESFASASAFLRSGCERRAGCLILDVGLPGMSGFELQSHLADRQSYGMPVPIVFITAQADSDGKLQERALRAGAIAFLHKPFGANELLRVVRSSREQYARGLLRQTARRR
jgi:FixJ family two-component response regulator